MTQMRTKPRKIVVECIACDDTINIGYNPKVGNFITCGNCKSQFEIIDLDPVTIDWPYFIDDDDLYEDLDDEDDY